MQSIRFPFKAGLLSLLCIVTIISIISIANAELYDFKKLENNFSPFDEYNFSEPGEPASDIKTYGDVIMIPVTPTPEGSGYSYYNPNGTDASYVIYSPGSYILESGFSTVNATAINISASSVTLDGNRQVLNGSPDGVGIKINRPYITVKNFAEIKNAALGIAFTGTNILITNNSFFTSGWAAIFGNTDYGTILNNTFEDSFLDIDGRSFNNTTIAENRFHSSLNLYGYNVSFVKNSFSQTYISAYGEKISYNNNNFDNPNHGFIVGGGFNNGFFNNLFNSVGIKDYDSHDTSVISNVFENNSSVLVYGINSTISGNTICNKSTIYGFGKKSTISDNLIVNNEEGVVLTHGEGDQGYTSWTITGNKFMNNSGYGIKIDNLILDSPGKIFNNYFANTNNTGGEGKPSWFIWTNPEGPRSGTNVMGGPYIAGNYWSNTEGTGWSDLQPVNPQGYTTTPYEIATDVNDTAPLVRTGSQVTHIISASAGQGGTISPSGEVIVLDGDEKAFYITPNQGMKVHSVIVDNTNKGSIPEYTFKDVRSDHIISASFTSLNPNPIDNNSKYKEWGIINSPIVIKSEKYRGSFNSTFK